MCYCFARISYTVPVNVKIAWVSTLVIEAFYPSGEVNIMSEKQSNKQQSEPLRLKEQAGNSPESSRRRLLKGTMAIPVIMTLHSGAALARTSNLVGTTQDINSAMKDPSGDLYCVHPSSDGDASSIPVDLGTSPTATINPIRGATARRRTCKLKLQHVIPGRESLCPRPPGVLFSQN